MESSPKKRLDGEHKCNCRREIQRWIRRNRLVTPKWARRFLSISHGKIYELLATGEIPPVRVGKESLRIRIWDLILYIRRNRVTKEDSQVTE